MDTSHSTNSALSAASISETAYRQIRREYDEKQLKAAGELRERIGRIEQQIPRIHEINSRIAALSVDMAVMRVKGQKADKDAYQKEKQALLSEKSALLKAAGFTEQDLAPRYSCDRCKDTGYIGSEPCSCLRTRLIEVLYDQSNIKEVLEHENFRTFSLQWYSPQPLPDRPDESPFSIAEKALRHAQDFVQYFSERSDNLLITGGTGTGKTFLSNCIAKEILDLGYSVIYLSAVKLFDILADEAFGRTESSPGDIQYLYICDLLIIDDLGTEITNSFTQSAFFNCVNERLLRNRHTIISTNLSIEQISYHYSERVFSRIIDKYQYIELLGSDIRISKKYGGVKTIC